jgi:predicted phosphodiesterase
MRTCFLGDIHGNSYALEACLDHLEGLKVDEIICLGDLVGWLPFGNRTLERMRSLDFPTVAGNHDLLVAGVFTDHPNQLDRMQATAYNSGLLSTVPAAISYLRDLPLILERESFTVVHHSPFHLPQSGKPVGIESFNYLDEPALAGCLDAWRKYPKPLIFSGHDHIPAVYELPEAQGPIGLSDVRIHRPPSSGSLAISLKPGSRYWIKAGSVGGPYRDGIPSANTVLYDSNSEQITLFRIEYPVDRLRNELASHHFHRNLATMQKYIELLDLKMRG